MRRAAAKRVPKSRSHSVFGEAPDRKTERIVHLGIALRGVSHLQSGHHFKNSAGAKRRSALEGV